MTRLLATALGVALLAVPAWAQRIVWDASPSVGVTAYRVYVDGVKVGETSALEWPLPVLTAGQTIQVGVSSVAGADEGAQTTIAYTKPAPQPASECGADGYGDGADNDGDGMIDEGCLVPQPIVLACPALAPLDASGPITVTYGASYAGGVPPVTLAYVPPSGSVFPVGTSTVTVTAIDLKQQTASCQFAVTVRVPPADTTGPTVVIASLSRNGKSTNYTVTATATDPSGLRDVAIFVNGVRTLTCGASPCGGTISLKNTKATYTIVAVANDVYGNQAVSAPWTVIR